jgi:hypothetical protein
MEEGNAALHLYNLTGSLVKVQTYTETQTHKHYILHLHFTFHLDPSTIMSGLINKVKAALSHDDTPGSTNAGP